MTNTACNVMGILTALVLYVFFIVFIVRTVMERQQTYCNCVKRCETCGGAR